MAAARHAVRVFISSPSDVRPERLIAERVLRRLDREFAYHFRVDAVLWEREPLVATHHFQDFENISPPSTADIVVVVLWSRLGVPLPAEKFIGAVSGKVPVTGTEWEFEDALNASRNDGKPDLLLYQKTAPVTATLDDKRQVAFQLEQKSLVEDFLAHWFRNASGTEFTAASQTFADAAEFEDRLETHLRALLRRRLDVAGQELVPSTIVWHQNPFRGLESFEPEHAAIFFGRTRARNELRELLARQAERGCAFVLVMGASGSGKSSLVKAGLLPDLMLAGMVGTVALCRYALFRPSDASGDPLAALAVAMMSDTALPELAALRYTPERLQQQLRANHEQVAFAVEQGLAAAAATAQLTERGEARLVLLVDQLEELFTLEAVTPGARREFIATLETLARSGLVWVIATARSDFFDRLETLPELAALSAGEARYLLTQPDGSEIGQIIRQPAREAGVRFEVDAATGHSLDEVLREAAARDPSSLPLLEFTLDQLWHQRTESGLIGFAAYEALGRLEGAIGRRADEELDKLPTEVQKALPQVLRALVTVGQGTKGVVTSRAAPLARFAAGTPARRLVDAFLAPGARLLVASGDGDGVVVRVAHEALLTHWVRARDRIAEDRADLQLYARLEQAAARWHEADERDRDSLLLPPGLPLSEAEDHMARRREDMDATVVAYVTLSGDTVRGAERRRLRRLRTAVAGFALLAALAVGFGWWAREQQNAAEEARAEADRQRSAAVQFSDEAVRQREAAKRNAAQAEQSAADAEQSALKAKQQAETALLAQSKLVAGLLRPQVAHRTPEQIALLARAIIPADPGAPDRPFWNDAWDLFVTAVQRDQVRTVLRGHVGTLSAAALSPDGRRAATAAADGSVVLWNTGNGRRLADLRGHRSTVGTLAFSADGSRLLSTALDGSLRVWQAADGRPEAALTMPEAVLTGAIDPAGRRVVAGRDDGSALIWTPSDGRVVDLRGHTGRISSVAFAPGGATVLVGSADGTASLWSETGQALATFRGHRGAVAAVAFSPDGNLVATAGWDGAARIWPAAGGEPVAMLGEHGGPVTQVAFDPTGQRLATASMDRTARVWALQRKGVSGIALNGHGQPVVAAAFTADGSALATGGLDGTVRLWTFGAEVQGRILGSHRSAIVSLSFASDGKTLLSAATEGAARLWDLDAARSAGMADAADLVAAADLRALRQLAADELKEFEFTPAKEAAAAAPCDRLAADPYDRQRPAGTGVPMLDIDGDAAVRACRAAAEAQPDKPHLVHQLGRALERAGRPGEAMATYRKAAQAGHAAASRSLALLGGDPQADLALLDEAFRQGSARAGGDWAAILWDLGRDRAAAMERWRQAAAMGDPYSHQRLAEIHEAGDGLAADPAQATRHYALAARLYQDIGENGAATHAVERRGSLARQLDTALAARIWRESQQWQRTP